MGSRYVEKMLSRAAEAALTGGGFRTFHIGACAARRDGAIVSAANGAPSSAVLAQRSPDTHAEARLVRKLDMPVDVFVAHVRRDGRFGVALPCERCRASLKNYRCERVYFTTNEGWGVLHLT